MVHSMVLPLIIQIDSVLVITNERTSANGGGPSEGRGPGAAGNVESKDVRRPSGRQSPSLREGLGEG